MCILFAILTIVLFYFEATSLLFSFVLFKLGQASVERDKMPHSTVHWLFRCSRRASRHNTTFRVSLEMLDQTDSGLQSVTNMNGSLTAPKLLRVIMYVNHFLGMGGLDPWRLCIPGHYELFWDVSIVYIVACSLYTLLLLSFLACVCGYVHTYTCKCTVVHNTNWFSL